MSWAQDKLKTLIGLSHIARAVYDGLNDAERHKMGKAIARLRVGFDDSDALPDQNRAATNLCARLVCDATPGASTAYANEADWNALVTFMSAKVEEVDGRQFVLMMHPKGSTRLFSSSDVKPGDMRWLDTPARVPESEAAR